MNRKLAITDANIFIDLLIICFVDQFFLLPFPIATTIEVILELDSDQRTILHNYGIQESLMIEYRATVNVSLKFNKGFSQTDRSLLSWAHAEKALLISGERKMRVWCKTHGLDYHGILWVFDQLIEFSLITKHQAMEGMELLINENPRLPMTACITRIENWKSQIAD